jgi:hypothetical protein
MNYNNYYNDDLYRGKQGHNHEYFGNTWVGEARNDPHVHHLAGVSGEPIPVQGGHVHELMSSSTFDDGHYHRIKVRTGLQVPVGNDLHVHFVKGVTTLEDGHTHTFEITTYNQ